MSVQSTGPLQNLFPGVRYPIILAPMAGTVTPTLAAAVSNAGGLGSIGIGSATPDAARDMIEQTQALTDRPFNVNFFCHQPPVRDSAIEKAWINYLAPLFAEFEAEPPKELVEQGRSFIADDDYLRVVLENRPAVVSFHFGLPRPDQLVAIKAAGIVTLATATNLTDARRIAAAGIDGIVAQGIEAGGHRGIIDFGLDDQRLPTHVLVSQLVKHVDLPVIATGGIMNGQGIRAALEIGAVAAQIGTAFILCPESAANDGYRNALTSEASASTTLTPTLSGRPARGLFNRYIRYAEDPASPQLPEYPVVYDATRQLIAAAASHGSVDVAVHWAGQGAPLVREMPAAALVETLVNEMSEG